MRALKIRVTNKQSIIYAHFSSVFYVILPIIALCECAACATTKSLISRIWLITFCSSTAFLHFVSLLLLLQPTLRRPTFFLFDILNIHFFSLFAFLLPPKCWNLIRLGSCWIICEWAGIRVFATALHLAPRSHSFFLSLVFSLSGSHCLSVR